jgi:hypothetical protein
MHVANNPLINMRISLRPWKLKSRRTMGGLISPAETHLGVARGRLRRIEEGEAIHELTIGRQLIRDATHSKPWPICFHSKRHPLLSSHYDWEKSQFLTFTNFQTQPIKGCTWATSLLTSRSLWPQSKCKTWQVAGFDGTEGAPKAHMLWIVMNAIG